MPPEPPEPPVPLWELVQTHHVVARGFHAVFDSVGLSATQFGVLSILSGDPGDGPPPSQAEMARRVLVRPQTMGELLGGLVDAGLVTRDGGGGRGRRTALRLTEEGRRRHAEAAPAVAAFSAPSAIGLTPEEAGELVRMLRTVRATLASRSEEDAP